MVGKHGRATVRMKARLGQPGIAGFAPGGSEIEFASLNDTRD
jgi:hypothetical protein